ncbi:MAG TPA: alpha/beta hydrolase, partial [Candidatus Binatia bacterium]|nr:alpha/beta hydrolase [Candidatus Binatia bacterium]
GTDVDAAQGFATDCIGEIGVASADLHVYGTLQAADDVDAIRAQLGADRIVLYGESYGTRLAQVYASRHPDRLSALVLDGVVDMQSSGVDFWSESARGFDATFQATEAACLADAHCSADLDGHSGVALLRDFLTHAANGRQVMLPDPGGPSYEEVDPSEIEHAIATSLYTEAGRATVQRAVAELARGDSTVLGHLIEIDREIGPQGVSRHIAERSGPAIGAADSAGGIAAYYAIECADYDYPSGSAGDLAFEVAQRQADNEGIVLDAVVSQDMPCDYWPAHGSAVGKLTVPSIPTLVLAATTDPVTPPANADRTAARLPDGSLVTSQGGPHVTWRIANPCVDDAVDGLLLHGTLPPTGSTCQDRVADPYTPLPPTGQAGLPALDAMDAIRTETFALPELQYWDGIDRIEVPCSFGGSVDITTDATAPIRSMSGPSPAGVPVDYHYTGCDVSGSLAFDGDATYDPTSGVYRLTAHIGNDSLLLTVDKNEHRVVQGTWHGEPVNDHD